MTRQTATAASDDFEDILSAPAIHERDRVPSWLMRAQGRIVGLLSYRGRHRLALLLLLIAIVIGLTFVSMRVVAVAVEALDILAFVGLFLVNWVGNGGILVPIPGARFLGLVMIFQHAAVLPSWEVLVVGGAAMSLGMVSYYVAGARSAEAYARGDAEGAQQAVSDATILVDGNEPTDPASPIDGRTSRRRRLAQRFSTSFQRAQAKAQPTIEKRGLTGMFWLCFVPSPAATAAAFLGGVMRFGFARFLLAAFSSKFLLAAIIVLAGIVFIDQAQSVELPL